jgi:hypothetical protein
LNWTKVQHKSGRFLKELDSDELYDQLNAIGSYLNQIGSYLNQLTAAFGKTANRQWGRARDLAVDTAHDAEGAMRDNLAASLLIAIGIGVAVGYMIGRSSDQRALPAARVASRGCRPT